MKYRLLSFISMLILLTGCWDIEEADRMDYIHGVGVDYKDGKVVVHLQIINLANLGIPEITAGAESPVTIATSSGETISSTIHDIYHSAQRRLYWGHDTFAVLTEAALQHGKLQESIDVLNRFPETRYRINIYATNDDVKEVLKVSTLFQGSPVFTRITDLENTYAQSSLVKQLSVRELIIQLDEPGYNGIVPTIGIVEDTWETDKEPITMIKDIGIAQVTPTDIQGFILNDDVKGFRWTQDSERNNVTIYKDEKPASDIIVVNPKQTYNIEMKGDDAIFHLTIKAKGIINEMLQELDHDFIRKELEQTIKEEIMHTYKLALKTNSDIYRLSERLYRRKFKAWKKIETDGKIPLDENNLVVNIDIKLVDGKIEKKGPVIK